MYSFDAGIFALEPKKATEVPNVQCNTFLTHHPDIILYNPGRTEIRAISMYGDAVQWFGNIGSVVVKPGETKRLVTSDRLYIVTGLKVINKTGERAIVVAHRSDGTGESPSNPFTPKVDLSEVLKFLAQIIITKIPRFIIPQYTSLIKFAIEKMVNYFWPKEKSSVWLEIKDQVQFLIDKEAVDIVMGILEGDLNQQHDQILQLINEINKNSKEFTRNHYINIAESLIGFESKFIFPSTNRLHVKINLVLLPLYSQVVMMKMLFYSVGVNYAEQIGLNKEDVTTLQKYMDTLLNDSKKGVKRYISDTYYEQVNYLYRNSDPRNLFNNMMSVRSYIELNGGQYFCIWDSILNGSFINTNVNHETVLYSNFYGKQTGNLVQQSIFVKEMPQPLTPKLINGNLNKLISVMMYPWKSNEFTIGGIKLTFENNDQYVLGTGTEKGTLIEFKGALLISMTVWGKDTLKKFSFHFSDGRVETYGKASTKEDSFTFEMKGYHIVSMYMANDLISTGGQANNIAVSYQLVNTVSGL